MDQENATVVESENAVPDTIQPINKETVHRICSGQVVLSLAIAVKELVENAIDAKATIIEVRLKEYGSELVEVSDNGPGVRKENFSALTLKHYTSKIRQFSDLEFVSTLGFRGEALSSLCALAELFIITRHESADYATKIQYDKSGAILSETPTARPQGTTVSLMNLFSTLPVRRKEFLKNLKREFNKMCQLLYAYCLVSKGIKFTCTNQTSKGSKNTIVATQGLSSISDNIVSIFGPKQIASLIDVTLMEPDEALLQEFGIRRALGDPLPFTIECLISSAMHGSGRSAADRQFYFINSRPCEPTKIMKLVNEIYRQFNVNQYPFVYMNIFTESSQVDVNVTPDKRQIFLEKEKLLLAAVKASLLEAFKCFPSTYKVQNLDVSRQLEEGTSSSPRGSKRSLSDCIKSPNSPKNFLETFRKKAKNDDKPSSSQKFTLENFNFKRMEVDKDNINFNDPEITDISNVIACKLENSNFQEERIVDITNLQKNELESTVTNYESNQQINENNEINHDNKLLSKSLKVNTKEMEHSPSDQDLTHIESIISDITKCNEGTSINESLDFKITHIDSKHVPNMDIIRQINLKSKRCTRDDTRAKGVRQITSMKASLEAVREALENAKLSKNEDTCDTCVKFRSEITPEGNKIAEQELDKQISKNMFKEMKIIGQFNLGFIIAKLNNDLFIIDQHATDEKYNFEQLQLTTIMENQKLVCPKPLQLTSANEELLIENEEVFKKNGFTFKIDHNAEATKKVALTAIPLSKNYIFGKDDIDEMLFMLQDSSNVMVRPSRIRAMFASRACRKSVMVGKSLSSSEMKRLVERMGEIDQPWNCPHGRPTMRHLINLGLIQKE